MKTGLTDREGEVSKATCRTNRGRTKRIKTKRTRILLVRPARTSASGTMGTWSWPLVTGTIPFTPTPHTDSPAQRAPVIQ